MSLETVALEQERWRLTAITLKISNHKRFSLMVKLTLAGAIMEALALQVHAYSTASEIAGYAGAVALALVLAMRVWELRAERVEAWVIAAAAAQSLKSEMYRYRTSSGPYADHPGGNPEATLSERCEEILEKVRPIQKYAMEPDPQKPAQLQPLDADAYLAERVNAEISMFQEFKDNLPKVQGIWLKRENLLIVIGVFVAVALAFTQNQAYAAWVIIIAILTLASGVTAKAERYASLVVGYRAMPDRLNSIVAHWRENRGSLDQLVAQVEATILAEGQAWVAGVDEFRKEPVSAGAEQTVHQVI